MFIHLMIVNSNVPPPKYEAEMRLPGSGASFPVIIGITSLFFQSALSRFGRMWVKG
jgi:hypothetical protein